MRPFVIPGFPDVHPQIELPNIAELLVQPMVYKMDADLFRQRATSDQKAILDRAPLTNDRKYVSVAVKVNLFYPSTAYGADGVYAGHERGWHRDGHVDLFRERTDVHHLLLSECEVLTEFNTIRSVIDAPDDMTVNSWLAQVNAGAYPLAARKMPANAFVTFTDHLHRPIDPRATHHQFRYSFRIIESDENQPLPWPGCVQQAQQLLPHHTEDHHQYRINIERRHGARKVVLHLPDDPYADIASATSAATVETAGA